MIQRLIVSAFSLIAAVPCNVLGDDLNITSFCSFANQTNIQLQASGNIMFSGGILKLPVLPPGASGGQLLVQAGGNIVVPNGVTVSAGPGWAVTLRAGANSSPSLCASEGSVDNQGGIIADGGSIVLEGRNINQSGLLQANSSARRPGIVVLTASRNIQLAETSDIHANGDANAPSAGGIVVIKSGGAFRDSAGSQIQAMGGANEGNGGNVEISAPNILSLDSIINTGAQKGWSVGSFSLDPENIVLGTTGTTGPDGSGTINGTGTSGTLNVNVNTAFQNITAGQILLEASGNISLNANTTWDLSQTTGLTTGQLKLEAGGNITLGSGTTAASITDENGWSVTLEAGYNFAAGAGVVSGVGTVTLSGGSSIKTAAGGITVVAGNDVTVASGGIVTGIANGAVITSTGGNISVQALSGSVNCGTSTAGYTFTTAGNAVNPGLGGISTASGGNVNIQAGANITAPLPAGNAGSQSDYGSGAFGAGAGNVTLTAGGTVTGHYVLANGTGSIMANNAGTSPQNLALSLIKGGWLVNAADNIVLQEARNPNGVFNNITSAGNPFRFLFNYDPMASVTLEAGNGVTITGSGLPRTTSANEGLIFPPSLVVEAGGGGITLDQSLSLFPSALGTLDLTTTNGGNLSGVATICVSDSSSVQWANLGSFTGSSQSGDALHLNDPNPVQINISGSISGFTLVSPKPVQMYVTDNIVNSSAITQNLHPTDTTTISAGGEILNYSSYVIVTLANGQMPNFNALNQVSEPYILDANSNSIPNPNLIPVLENQQNQFSYDPSSGSLLYLGTMSAAVESALLAMPAPFVPATTVQQIYAQSQNESAITIPGFSVAGPGVFRIDAASMDLGNSGGVVSLGIENYPALAPYTSVGAEIDISLAGNLSLIDSAIESAYGGNINVTNGGAISVGSVLPPPTTSQRPLGIVSLWRADIRVIAGEDVDIGGSRIAAYDGGNIVVESLNGSVNIGSGCNTGTVLVQKPYLDAHGNEQFSDESIGFNGLIATSFSGLVYGQTSSSIGSVTVSAAQEIAVGPGGIFQEPMGPVSGGTPTLTLHSGGPLVLTTDSCGPSPPSLAVAIGSEVPPVISAASLPYVFNEEINVTNLTADAGTNVQFCVTVGNPLLSGAGVFIVTPGNSGPVVYDSNALVCQWFKNGTNLPGATNMSLSLTNIRRADAGTYSVVVSAPYSQSATNGVQLRVLVAQLLSVRSTPANRVSVSFSAADSEPLTGADIPSFVIQTSTNLVDWSPAILPLSTNGNGSLSFSPPVSPVAGQGFYRVLSQ